VSAAPPSPAQAKRRLGWPHFAHLRGVLQGLDAVESAKRYLGAESAEDAREAHAEVVAAARALAARQHKAVFRQEHLAELFDVDGEHAVLERDLAIDRWAEAKGIDVEEWDRDELIAAYETEHERSAEDVAAEAAADGLRARLERQLRTLAELEATADVSVHGHHLVSEWFDAKTAGRLLRAGILRLDELQQRIAADVRWYKAVEAIGAGKAAAITAYVDQLLPPLPAGAARPPARVFAAVDELLGVVASPAQVTAAGPGSMVAAGVPMDTPMAVAVDASVALPSTLPVDGQPGAVATHEIPVPRDIVEAAAAAMPAALRAALAEAGLDGREGLNRNPWREGALRASNDLEAIVAWVRARAGAQDLDNFSPQTARLYLQQALRLMLWCASVRRIPLSSMQREDCEAYMAWLRDIPADWISRGRAPRWSPGWTPFASQLTRASRQHAIRVASALCGWLNARGYLRLQPWKEVKLRLRDDPGPRQRQSRAFTPEAWTAIVDFLERPPVLALDLTPRRRAELLADWERARFIVHFNSAVGLRGTELVTTELSAFRYVGGSRWRVAVLGKGGTTQEVRVPPQAMRALDRYLVSRGLPPLGDSPAESLQGLPIVARADDPTKAIGYRALLDTFRAWVQRAMDASSLPVPERELALRATTHWLRHTMATVADEHGASRTVIQQQLRHRDARTTENYLAAREHRADDELDRAFA